MTWYVGEKAKAWAEDAHRRVSVLRPRTRTVRAVRNQLALAVKGKRGVDGALRGATEFLLRSEAGR